MIPPLNYTLQLKVNLLSKKYTSMDDAVILEKIQHRPEEADDLLFYLVYGRYYRLIGNQAEKICTNNPYFEDLLSELHIHLRASNYKALSQFRGECPFPGWLRKVAYRDFLNNMVKMNSVDTVPIEDFDVQREDNETPDNVYLLRLAIDRLKNKDQSFVLHKIIEGYSPEEIAQMLTLKQQQEKHCEDKVLNVDYVYMMKARALTLVGKMLVAQLQNGFASKPLFEENVRLFDNDEPLLYRLRFQEDMEDDSLDSIDKYDFDNDLLLSMYQEAVSAYRDLENIIWNNSK